MASKSVIFKGTLSMLHRTVLHLEQFSFPTSFGKRFETVRDDLGSLLGWFGKAKIVISLGTSCKNQILKGLASKTLLQVLVSALGRLLHPLQESS